MPETFAENLLKDGVSKPTLQKNAEIYNKEIQKPNRDHIKQLLYGSYHSINACPSETIVHQSVNFLGTSSPKTKRGCDYFNYIKMVTACLTFVPVGMATTILGATLLQVKDQTGTSSADMALLFTWRGLGAVAGNCLTGVIFHRLKPELLLCLAVMLLGMTQAGIPLCQSYGILVPCIVGSGLSIGMLGSGLNAYVVALWKERAAPFIQALHFSVSCGSMLGPLISALFLQLESKTELPESINYNNTVFSNASNTLSPLGFSGNNVTEELQKDHREMALNQVLHEGDHTFAKNVGTQGNGTGIVVANESKILYPYLVISLLTLLAFTLYVCLICCKCQKEVHTYEAKNTSKDSLASSKNSCQRKIALILLNVICFCSGGMEGAFGGYITVFAVESLHLTSSVAALLVTTFWGSFALGRGLSVFVVQWFRSQFIIICNWLVVTLSLVLFFLFFQSHIAVSFTCSSLTGIALSSILGNVLCYTNTHLEISAKITASYVISFYAGMMACPSLLGVLMDIYSPEILLYFLFAISLFAFKLFLILHFWWMKRRDGSGCLFDSNSKLLYHS